LVLLGDRQNLALNNKSFRIKKQGHPSPSKKQGHPSQLALNYKINDDAFQLNGLNK
jgi:hypothetical protein